MLKSGIIRLAKNRDHAHGKSFRCRGCRAVVQLDTANTDISDLILIEYDRKHPR
jgi:hypothetical protein